MHFSRIIKGKGCQKRYSMRQALLLLLLVPCQSLISPARPSFLSPAWSSVSTMRRTGRLYSQSVGMPENEGSQPTVKSLMAENALLKNQLSAVLSNKRKVTMDSEEFVGGESMWCDQEGGEEVCVVDSTSFEDNLKERGRWLVGLLVLQSCSSFILSSNEALLQKVSVLHGKYPS